MSKLGRLGRIILLIAALAGMFAIGNVVGSCRASQCLTPWAWWRSLAGSDQAAWASALATSAAVLVALMAPWLTVWATRSSERADIQRKALHLVLTVRPIVISMLRRIRAVQPQIAQFIEQYDNGMRWQWVSGMRIPEAHHLDPYRSEFYRLESLGPLFDKTAQALLMIAATLPSIDDELASFERYGPAIGTLATIDQRTKHILSVFQSMQGALEAIEAELGQAEEVGRKLA